MAKYVKLFEDHLPGERDNNNPDTGFDANDLSNHDNNEKPGVDYAHGFGTHPQPHDTDYDVPAPGYLDGTRSDELEEDVADPLIGGEAEKFKTAIDSKTAALNMDEDTVLTPGPQQKNDQELLANDDLSSHVNPVTYNESKALLSKKIGKNMKELKKGTLKTGSGKKVTDTKQALAISYSEAGESKKKKNESMVLDFNSFVTEGYNGKAKNLNAKKASEIKKIAKDPKARNAEQKKANATRKQVRKAVTESQSYSVISKEAANSKAEMLKAGHYDDGKNHQISDHNKKMLADEFAHSSGFQTSFDYPNVPEEIRTFSTWIERVCIHQFSNIRREEGGAALDFSAMSEFIKNHVTPIAMTFLAKYGYLNRGIIETIVLQDFV